jgi:ubiquitin-activating enzyme E1
MEAKDKAKDKTEEIKLDENRYSRTIFTYGIETMKKLLAMKVLIVGMRGLGVETAKNIILNGPGEVDIFDPTLVKINDLGSNFYLSEEDVGKKNRDDACLSKLSELNPYVKVSILKVEENKDVNEYIKNFCEKIKKYNVVVFTEIQPMYFLAQVDKVCRSNNIKLIYGVCLGLAGYVFSDFGEEHTILDETGEEPKTYIVKSISKDKEGLVIIDNIQGTNNLKLGDEDYVRFENVEGMIELNDKDKIFKIKFIDYQSFCIGDTSEFGDYIKGGDIYEVKIPKKKNYFDFCARSAMISDPMHPFNIPDITKKGRSELLYMAFSGVHDFYFQNKFTLPELNNMEQARKILENVRQMYNQVKAQNIPWYSQIQEFDEKIVLNVARWAAANIPPVCGFFGGILAQEIIKATGKYTPIDQWFIHDFFEVVENIKDDADRTLKNCRYDDQIAIFGNEIQEKIQKSNIFMVGAGATGCEFLKNFGMMGFCSDKNALFTVTDNDNIEISNLSRQFLFKNKDVGKSKSAVAIQSVKEMNPNFNGEGLQDKICDETEAIFNEDFWNKQNFIIYAVDSIEARKYIDNKVILYQKPAVDSGTLGTQAHSQIIIPHKTCTYNDRAPSGVTIKLPVCTLRHFPSLIQHCIEWSRDSFSGYFGNIINEVKQFFVDYESFKMNIKREGSPKLQLEKLNVLKMHIDSIVNKDIKKMCEYGIQSYTKNFDHKIQQLLFSFPPDYKNKDGSDFWAGSRRLPHPIHFNPDIDLCLEYVRKFVQILSHSLGISLTKEELSKENIKNICSSIKVPEYVKTEVKIDLNEENKKDAKAPPQIDLIKMEKESPEQIEAQKEIDEIMKELDKIKRDEFDANKINPEVFEKDHDENGHIDFINAGANLRARNYHIAECDRNKTKKIAGDIMATILTTTASIAGVVSLQLYTMFQTDDIKYFRNCCYLNLGSNSVIFIPPSEPYKIEDNEFDKITMGPVKAIPEGWNVWDRILLKESKTCGELIDYLKKTYNIDVDMLSADGVTIITTFLDSAKSKYGRKIEDIYEENSKKKINEKKNYLNIQVIATIPEAKIGEKTHKNVSVFMPTIKYIFR